MKVLIVDDHNLLREGIKNIILNSPLDVDEFFQAENGEIACEIHEQENPDITIMDVKMPVMDGINASEIILKENPAAKILVLTMFHEMQYVNRLLKLGVHGYLLKNSIPEELQIALTNVLKGKKYISPEIATIIIDDLYTKSASVHIRDPKDLNLSYREKEIIKLVCDELTTEEIAEKLSLSKRTIDTHRLNIYRKLGVHNLVGLVKVALRYGLTSL